MIGGLWLFPFLATKSFAGTHGRPWRDAEATAQAIYDAVLLKGTGWLVLALGLAGLLILLSRRSWKSWYVAVVPIALFAFGNSTLLEAVGLSPSEGLLGNVSFPRLSIPLKPFFFVAAGTTVAVALRGVAGWRPRRLAPRSMHALVVACVAVTVAPVIPPLYKTVRSRHMTRKLTPVEERKHAEDFDAFVAWAKDLPRDGVWRWLFYDIRSHKYVDLSIDLDALVYTHGSMPCAIYKYKIGATDDGNLEASNIRYIMSEKPLKRRSFKPIKQIGALHVYEFTKWTPDPFKVIDGAGDVELISYAHEEIVLRAAEGAHGVLRLNVSHFPRWKATVDGQPLEIGTHTIRKRKRSGYMTVPLRPGTYRFSFERSALDYFSSAAGLLFLAGALFLLLFRPAQRLFLRLRRRLST
jgi:hypothetical protein